MKTPPKKYAYILRWVKANKERVRKYAHEYYLRHREKLLAKQRIRWRKTHPNAKPRRRPAPAKRERAGAGTTKPKRPITLERRVRRSASVANKRGRKAQR